MLSKREWVRLLLGCIMQVSYQRLPGPPDCLSTNIGIYIYIYIYVDLTGALDPDLSTVLIVRWMRQKDLITIVAQSQSTNS